jgi:non-homologous end joining protein Ku
VVDLMAALEASLAAARKAKSDGVDGKGKARQKASA